jgi:hypothetical protein
MATVSKLAAQTFATVEANSSSKRPTCKPAPMPGLTGLKIASPDNQAQAIMKWT